MKRRRAIPAPRRRRGSALLAVGCSLGALLSVPAPAQSVADWHADIAEAAARFDIPVAWIERVMQAESGGRTTVGGRPIVSPAGARGLMQLMPATWAELRAVYHLGSDPDDPHDNILAGAGYLRAMYDRFGYPGLFAAYNAGPARYADYLTRQRALPLETRAYLHNIEGELAVDAVRSRQAGPAPGLFAIRSRPPDPDRGLPERAPDLLFAIRSDR